MALVGSAAARSFLLLAHLVTVVVGLAPVLATTEVVAATAPASEPSVARAMAHVRDIAAEPQPMASPRHGAAVIYLVEQLTALGLRPEVQVSSIAVIEGAT